jgi:hypothetical protein
MEATCFGKTVNGEVLKSVLLIKDEILLLILLTRHEGG